MLTAFDANEKKIVAAEHATRDHSYFCSNEFCRAKLVLRKTENITPHFAHFPGTSENGTPEQRACIAEDMARKANDLSEWTRKWHRRFPVEIQTRAVRYGGAYKFADVLFAGNKTVLQLQHTRLKKGEFGTRNRHFAGAGYRLVWVFDGSQMQDRIARIPLSSLTSEQQKIAKEKNQYFFNFSAYDKYFEGFDPELEPNISLYLTYPAKDGTEYLYRICWVSPFAHEKFAAVATSTSAFLHDCKGRQPVPQAEAEAIRQKVLAKRSARKQKWMENNSPKCPRCGRTMTEKTNSITGQKFWGCPDRSCWSR